MPYLDTHTRTTSSTSNDNFQPMGRVNTYPGLYLGFVKDTSDIQKNGRIKVWIPELGSAPENEDGWVIVSYSSPFAGATNIETASQTNYSAFDKTQTSYGFWMIPPDINNEVLVMFINGKPDQGVWIGCLYNQFMNHMVPGMAASTKNYQYPGKYIPTAEYNKWDEKATAPATNTTPYEKTKFLGVSNQGLINDKRRGVTSSSARRESPSNVFGILTPGPVIDKSAKPEDIRRKGGSSFIMDDGEGSEYVQLSTKSGAQIRLDETSGFVYLINRDGTAWVQMDKEGNIDIFGAKNISMRAQRDVNIRADRNVNIEAGQNVFIKAAKDTTEGTTTFTYDVNNVPQTTTIPCWQYVGEGNGSGGNIVLQSLDQLHSTSKNNSLITSKEGNIDLAAKVSFLVTTDTGGQNFSAKSGILMTTEGALDLSTTGNIRAAAKGTVSLTGEGDTVICTNSNLSLNASGQIIVTSGDKTSMDATSIEIGTVVKVPTLEAQLVKSVSTETNSIKSDTIAVDGDPLGGGYSGGATPSDPSQPLTGESPMSASPAQAAEVKAMVEKINILATWKPPSGYQQWQQNVPYSTGSIVEYSQKLYIAMRPVPGMQEFDTSYWNIFIPEDKFQRNSQSLETITTRLPTYEPCPEHGDFSYSSITGYTPKQTAADATYGGSGANGNGDASQPPSVPTPGSENTQIPPESPADSAVSKDINLNALKCQLTIHEGSKNVSYKDTKNLLTGGIGHLLRTPTETEKYPLGSPISEEQIQAWYLEDVVSSIKGAQRLIGVDVWGDLSDIRKRACADLCYNLGEGGLGKFKNFIAAMKAKDFNTAGKELQDSLWYKQVGRRGPNVVTMIVQNTDPNGCDRKFPPTDSAKLDGGTVVVGDTIAVGIGKNIPGATVSASIGYNSAKTLLSVTSNTKVHNAKMAIISVGSTDIPNAQINQAKLKEDLLAIRTALKADSYVWIVPYNETASNVVLSVAGSDKTVSLSQYATFDGVTPSDYQAVAAAAIKK